MNGGESCIGRWAIRGSTVGPEQDWLAMADWDVNWPWIWIPFPCRSHVDPRVFSRVLPKGGCPPLRGSQSGPSNMSGILWLHDCEDKNGIRCEKVLIYRFIQVLFHRLLISPSNRSSEMATHIALAAISKASTPLTLPRFDLILSPYNSIVPL